MTESNQTPESRSGEFERISPAYVRLDEPEAQPGYREPESPMSTAILLWALFGLLCLAAAVFLWLPGEVAERESQPASQAPPSTTQPSGQPQAASPAKPAGSDQAADTEAAVDASLDAREEAEKLRAEVSELRSELREAGAEKWAAEAWQGLTHLFDKGERELQARNFDLANIAFSEARESAVGIQENADEIYAELMSEGQSKLDAGDANAAMKSFDLALAVKPDDKAALKLMDRAIKRGDVLELMRNGRNLETAEDFVGARDAYAKAVDADSEYQPAVIARDRTQALINDRAYRARLSEGLAQMEQGNYEQARETLEAARRLRPKSEEVADALSQVNATLKARSVDQKKEKANSAEQAEQWRDAEAAYKAILAEDPSLEFAQSGSTRAADRAKLDETLAAMLDNRGRLSEAAVRDEARQLLSQAKSVASRGPRITGQIASMEKALKDAQTPVSVVLQSDGDTRVVVHHLGELGTFDQKTVELLPGNYTAMGSRDGYRDVRIDFTIEPGAAAASPVRVVCQETI